MLVYESIGGMQAVAWNDAVQASTVRVRSAPLRVRSGPEAWSYNNDCVCPSVDNARLRVDRRHASRGVDRRRAGPHDVPRLHVHPRRRGTSVKFAL